MNKIEETPDKNQNNLQNFKALFRNSFRLSSIIFQHMPYLFSSMIILTIIIGIIPIFSAKALGALIDKIIEGVKIQDVSIAYPALMLFAILTTIPTVIRNIISFIDRHLFLKMQDLFELITLKKRGSFDIAQYEDPKFQDKLQRAFNNGIFPIIYVLDAQIRNLEILCGIIVGSIAAATIDWRVFLLVLITSIPNFWVDIKHGNQIWGIWAKNSTEQRRFIDLRRFFMQKISVIDSKLYQTGEKFLSDIKDILKNFTKEQLKAEHSKTIMKTLASIFSAAGLFVGTAIIINDAIYGLVAIGTVVFAFETLNRVSGWTSSMLSNTAKILERNLYVTDIFGILDENTTLKYPEQPKKIDGLEAPKIVFENVYFKYPSQKNWALKNISFTMTPGQKIGLVGNNAAQANQH